MSRGKFITFEGIDGSGKTTQAALFADYLRAQGHDVVLTKDPGGSDVSAKIRTILVEGNPGDLDVLTELFLFQAARVDLVTKTIKPALDAGKWVVCDRFYDSTTAYQGVANGTWERMPTLFGMLRELNVSMLSPDLTFIIDVPVEVGMSRAMSRPGAETRFEKKGLDYLQKVRDGFLLVNHRWGMRARLVDGRGDIMTIHREIAERAQLWFAEEEIAL